MKIKCRKSGSILDHPEVDIWVIHYDKGEDKTFIMLGDETIGILPGEASVDMCLRAVSDKWIIC